VLAQFEVPVGRKTSLLQSLEHYAPRKGTLVFEGKGSFERKTQSTSAAPAAAATAPAPATSSSPAQQPLISWTAEQVAAWLAGIGEAHVDYSMAFVKNGIDGEELLNEDFGQEELGEMGVASKMHQKRILREIKKLRR
jgi:hypothetical protein